RAPNAARALEALVDLAPDRDARRVRDGLATALKLVTNQRLVPTADPAKRVAAFEVLATSAALSQAIRDGTALPPTNAPSASDAADDLEAMVAPARPPPSREPPAAEPPPAARPLSPEPPT